MMTPTSDGLLAQILTTLTSLGERLAVVEADLKTVIRDHTKDLDDHEARIRIIEADARDHVTFADLAERDAIARADSDRAANKRMVALGLVFAGLQVVEGAGLYLLTT